MFDHIIAKVVLGWMRHVVGMAGAAAVAHGYLSSSEGDQLTGALMIVVPLAFSAYDKWSAENKVNAAILAATKEGPTK